MGGHAFPKSSVLLVNSLSISGLRGEVFFLIAVYLYSIAMTQALISTACSVTPQANGLEVRCLLPKFHV
jgi:hypothetical protein